MTRLFKDKDFVNVGHGCKISYVNSSTNDVRCYCSYCRKWTFHKLIRDFDDLNGVWNGVYSCKDCGS